MTATENELYAWRQLFGSQIAHHEWWCPGPRMGDPEYRVELPDGHDALKEDWQRTESRATCRKCKFERFVSEARNRH